jgi:hypothetical protein
MLFNFLQPNETLVTARQVTMPTENQFSSRNKFTRQKHMVHHIILIKHQHTA